MNYLRLLLPSLLLVVASTSIADDRSTTIDIKATVKGACQISSAAEINFNNLTPTDTSDKTASGSLTFWCTKDQPYTISFNDGQNLSGGKRRMRGVITTTAYIPYDLNSTTITGIGKGPATPVTVQIPATVKANDYRNAALGAYKDTLTVTLQN
ncbi:MAG: spore coat protein U domain-containing protein [Rhodocyclaceae bacterium]|jgi:spore coat protein U-like protein|nr:spore coat protein U domain-containing protein [Rhodocyclaceae bacterium]